MSDLAAGKDHTDTIEMLRSEARMLTTAGLVLLGAAVPVTLVLAAMALGPDGPSASLPLVVGGAPILLGYLVCRAASARLSKAKSLAGGAD